MKYNVAVCDDEEKDLRIIHDYFDKLSSERKLDFDIRLFQNSEEMYRQYQLSDAYDIVFLDVEMPGMSGLQLAERIRLLPDRNVAIVFMSNYPEYMKDSFDVHAFQYLTKPVVYEEFMRVVLRIIKENQENQSAQILVEYGDKQELIDIDDIIMVTSENAKGKELCIHLSDRSIYTVGTIAEWEKEYQQFGLVSPYRGILVNLLHIHYFRKDEIVMRNKQTVPLSRRKEKELRMFFQRNVIIRKNKR